ncbi:MULTISPECIES: thiol-disulfide oxidoreductase DCC family protein [Chitinophagaceae]
METAPHNHIVLFDGVCNLCSGAVQFILKRDKENKFRFASLQSKAGQPLLEKFEKNNQDLKSIVYVQNEKIYTKSTAVLRIARELGGTYTLLYWLCIIPRPIRDAIYDFVARNRYKWFGKKKECWVPTKELQERFL